MTSRWPSSERSAQSWSPVGTSAPGHSNTAMMEASLRDSVEGGQERGDDRFAEALVAVPSVGSHSSADSAREAAINAKGSLDRLTSGGPMSTAQERTQHLIDAIEVQHGNIQAELVRLVERLISTVTADEPHEPARRQLVSFLRNELLLHLETERKLLHVVGNSFESTKKLADAMAINHRQILAFFRALEERDTGMGLALAAGSIVSLVEVRLQTENTVLLPALVANGVDLETLLAGRAEILGDTVGKP